MKPMSLAKAAALLLVPVAGLAIWNTAANAEGVKVFGREMEALSTQIGRIREANLVQAENIATMSASLTSDGRVASEPA